MMMMMSAGRPSGSGAHVVVLGLQVQRTALFTAGSTFFLLVLLLLGMWLPSTRTSSPAGDGNASPAQPHRPVDRVYVIHSFWSENRRDWAPKLCERLRGYVGAVECVAWPGVPAADLDLPAWQRFLGGEAYVLRTPPPTSKTWLEVLGGVGTLLTEGGAGCVLSHMQIMANWTHGTLQPSPLPPHARVLVLEDDAQPPPDLFQRLAEITRGLPHDFGALALDSKESVCSGHVQHHANGTVMYGTVKPWVKFSRATAMLYTIGAAKALLDGLPAYENYDLYLARVMRRRTLKMHVACPVLVPPLQGIESELEKLG